MYLQEIETVKNVTTLAERGATFSFVIHRFSNICCYTLCNNKYTVRQILCWIRIGKPFSPERTVFEKINFKKSCKFSTFNIISVFNIKAKEFGKTRGRDRGTRQRLYTLMRFNKSKNSLMDFKAWKRSTLLRDELICSSLYQ